VDIVGTILAGLPSVGLPHVGAANSAALIAGAAGIALVVFSEALGAGDTFASKHGYEIRPNQEMIALGVANLGSGLLGGLVAGGGMSGTAGPTSWVRLVSPKTCKRGGDCTHRKRYVTTDYPSIGETPIPLDEWRNSITPRVATHHQSLKRG
jgi:hypothetical protein